jgi:hypothetical protein
MGHTLLALGWKWPVRDMSQVAPTTGGGSNLQVKLGSSLEQDRGSSVHHALCHAHLLQRGDEVTWSGLELSGSWWVGGWVGGTDAGTQACRQSTTERHGELAKFRVGKIM